MPAKLGSMCKGFQSPLRRYKAACREKLPQYSVFSEKALSAGQEAQPTID